MTLLRNLFPQRALARVRKALGAGLATLGSLGALLLPTPAAAVDLADMPLFSTISVPGNLALALSVEWPTATTPAYPSTVAYSSASTYLGYFDPEKCYVYTRVNTGTTAAPNYSTSYFAPDSLAASHACTSTATKALWSGNYLNWASMQTLDAFRWVLTGGYRSVDTATSTVLTKTNALQDSTVMPYKTISSGLSGATPFNYASGITRLRALGTAMWFTTGAPLECSFTTTTAGANTFSCTTSQGAKSCNSNGTTACTVTVTDGGDLQCTRTGTGPYAYSCLARNASATVGAQCTASNIAKVANANTTASCSVATTGTYPIVDYNGESTAAATAGVQNLYRVYINVKVCDSTVGLETNCKAYSQASKPEGLMQAYASKLRYSAFGYYNDSTGLRDGGVMRARMKYIGPTKPVPGSAALTNAVTEWNATTGVMVTNPDSTDASATVAMASAAGRTVTISNSGVMNYLNKFGYFSSSYKSKDPVGELYYAATRYFKNLGNVPEYTSLSGAANDATATTWLDGFPSIATWDDPMLYSCQKNFILGIGDVNTWNDVNLPGTTLRSATTNEPALPTSVSGDATVDTAVATNMVGKLEGFSGNLSTYYSAPNSTACANTGSQCNGYLMAGLAYDSHTKDIRTDLSGKQTINTYWMDVLENQVYRHKNAFWLATKYGGFTVPTGFDPYAGGNGASTLGLTTWYNNTDTLTIGTAGLAFSTDTTGSDKRPDNYFPGNRPELMKSGLTAAFEKIASEAEAASSTAFATVSPTVTTSGTISYSADYDPKKWIGALTASTFAYADDGSVTPTDQWEAGSKLDATTVTASTRKIITCCTSAGAGLAFTNAALTAATLDARTYLGGFAAVSGVASGSQSTTNYIAYLRGDRSQELANGGVYRTRSSRLGDIVNSKPLVIAAPDALYYDVYNPGYSAYRRTYNRRWPVVYVGANDGMLHAFDGRVGETTSGKELFAYVPSFLYGTAATAASTGLAALGNPSFTHHYYVDGPLASFDVDINRAPGSASTTPAWRTLLVGGLGKGGKGYFALDVTASDDFADFTEAQLAAKLLWEFTDSRLGYSFGKPSIVKTKKYGWVAIFPSGYNNADGKGYFFFVNPRTGALLEAVATPEGSTASPIDMGNLSAYTENYTDFTADAVYGTDLRGNIWRLDLTASSGDYPSPVKIATLADDSGVAQPITTRPLIEVDTASKKRYVLVGTGRLLADSDIASNQTQSIYAVRDGTSGTGKFYTASTMPTGYSFPIGRSNLVQNSSLTVGIGSSPASPMGWYHDLAVSNNIAERVNVQPISNGNVLVFGANLPNGQACSPSGSGTVYALDFPTGQTVLEDADGNLVGSNSAFVGVITDIAIQRVGGKLRIYAGSSTGQILNPKAKLSGSGAVRILNWRELPAPE